MLLSAICQSLPEEETHEFDKGEYNVCQNLYFKFFFFMCVGIYLPVCMSVTMET